MPRGKYAREYPQARERERAVLAYIAQYKREHDGNSPTMRQIARRLGLKSTSMVAFYLNNLECQGKIMRRDTGDARAICLVGGRYAYIEPGKGGSSDENV